MVEWSGLSLEEKIAYLFKRPFGLVWMCSKDLSTSQAEIDDLRERILRLRESSTTPEEIAYECLTHPACVRRMYAALGIELRRSGCPVEAQEDILRHCLENLLLRFMRTQFASYNDSKGKLHEYLFEIWIREIRLSRRGTKRDRQRREVEREYLESKMTMKRPREISLSDIAEAVQLIKDTRTRLVMLDMVAGMTGEKSAALRNLTPGRISQIRSKGVRFLRNKLGQ